jgi:nitroreductase
MDVRDAVASRFSCRAFLPTPVPLATVRDILERAARAPSGGNLQPWRVYALAGAVLEDLKARIRPHAPSNPRGEGAEYQVYPSPLKEPYNSRRFEVGADLYRAISVPREDRPARYRQYARNFEFFGAPVGLLFTIDRSMGAPQWSDLGMYVQTVMLLARAYGLDTCSIEAWTHWHKTASAFLACRRRRWCFVAWRSAMATRRRRSTAGGRPGRPWTALRASPDLSQKGRRSVDAVCG